MTQQPARFIFKLRRNIALEGDLTLAKMELDAFLPESVRAETDLAAVAPEFARAAIGAPDAHVREAGAQGYSARGPLALLPVLIRRLTFVQRIYCVTARGDPARALLARSENDLGAILAVQASGEHLLVQAIPHYALIELADIVARRSTSAQTTQQNLQRVLDVLLNRSDDRRALRLAEQALSAASTTGHLAHDLHYYKAKFFPRLARAMLNVGAQRMQSTGAAPRVLDNFTGSGTTLVEAAALGLPSVGLDLDPLSVLIAATKLQLLSSRGDSLAIEYEQLRDSIAELQSGQPPLFASRPTTNAVSVAFPAWLLKNRKMTPDIAAELCGQIAALQAAVGSADAQTRDVLRVLLSDAIARKIRMRFLGTGVGRFSLTFARLPLPTLLERSLARYVKVTAAMEWLRHTLRLQFAAATMLQADARALPGGAGGFDLLLTSPPYLPASSGRESYARARAPSLIALGMRSVDDVDHLVDGSVGSMEGEAAKSLARGDAASNGAALQELTTAELRAVKWLQQDALRAIKAAPTARYFLDMRKSFGEMHRVLRPGALAVVVSGKQSTFYEFSSRKTLYVVPAAEILADEASRAGFEVEGLHDVMLYKANRNARPRSLDDYYETLIMLRRP